ncbi:MAG: TMEM175 family protein [Candidatus Omnitrophota bacterium]
MTEEAKTGLKTSRIEALSDGIFAIAMTILILSFETVLQHPSQINEAVVDKLIIGLWPDFLHYTESFIILGAFWYQHHRQFHYIKSVDMGLIVINIIGLMFIGLIPFTTVLVSDFGHTLPAAVLFELNLLVAGLIFFVHWIYASTGRRLLDPDISPDIIRFYAKRNLVIPVVSLCAAGLSFFEPRLGTILYFIVPVILVAWKRENL